MSEYAERNADGEHLMYRCRVEVVPVEAAIERRPVGEIRPRWRAGNELAGSARYSFLESRRGSGRDSIP